MAQWLKHQTAVTIKMGPFIDDIDGKTAETGLTIAQADIRLTKNGGAFAQTHNSVGATHDENGYYGVPLDATDTDSLGRLRVAISKVGALPVWQDFVVVSANVFDSLIGGGDRLDVDAVLIEGLDATEQIHAAIGDKTGFKLAADGLDLINIESLTGVASNFPEMVVQVWRRFFRRVTCTNMRLKTYKDDGLTVITEQAVSDDGVTQTQESAQ
jgi:hypothetical protein